LHVPKIEDVGTQQEAPNKTLSLRTVCKTSEAKCWEDGFVMVTLGHFDIVMIMSGNRGEGANVL
jgi:hypothetical protein